VRAPLLCISLLHQIICFASMAKRGADEMADRYLIENREAAVGVQMFHMRQRWGARCGVAGANAGPPW
jgi:hypothetical protein